MASNRSDLLQAMAFLRAIGEINNTMAVDEKTLIGLLIAYMTLILTGTTGNCLVCFIVARKPQMRNPRNAYIVNLAISDMLLCLFTMPFTLVQITLKYWPLGKSLMPFPVKRSLPRAIHEVRTTLPTRDLRTSQCEAICQRVPIIALTSHSPRGLSGS